MVGELSRTHVVRRAPVGRPVACWTERQIQVRRLPSGGVAQFRSGVVPAARARQRNAERKALASAVAAAADAHPWATRSVWRARTSLIPAEVIGSGTARRGRRVRRGSGAGMRAQPEQPPQPLQCRGCHGEGGGYALQEWLELRRIGADLSLPQIVGDRQLKTRQQVGQKRVRERPGLPAGVVRLLGLLEVVADPARADAQQPDLAWLRLACGVTGG